jgi:nitrite reductase/ring-hydroxylating ferredoxin subunit
MQTVRPGEWVDSDLGLGLADLDFERMQMRVSTDRYRSQEYVEAEREQIWMKVWQVTGRVDELPHEGDWKVHRIFDQSYIIVRGKDGEIRGFANACTHRGNALCSGKGNAQRFTCPYHLWSFDLEGKLRGVSRPDLVGEIDKDALGLRPVPVETFAGFIFMNPDPQAEPLAEFLGLEVLELLAPYHLDEMTTVLDVKEALDCNWKVVIDAFQEGYHIQGVHPELLRVIVIDPTTTRYRFPGDHTVAVAPFDVAHVPDMTAEQQLQGIRELPGTFPGVAGVLPAFEELVDTCRDESGALEFPVGVTARTLLQEATRQTLTTHGLDVSGLTDAQMTDNQGWLLFPNFFMTIRAGEATVIVPTPDPDGDPNRCFWHITSYMWLPTEYQEAFKAEALEVEERGSYQYFLALQQDYDQMQRQQTGLRNRMLDHLSLVKEEVCVAKFHERVDRYVAGNV